jgi:integrase
MDQLYEDRLDGKTDDEFWARKMNEWREQERRLESELLRLKVEVTADSVLTVQSILELANPAHFLYLTRNHPERGSIAETCPFELRYGWRNSLAYLAPRKGPVKERAEIAPEKIQELLNALPEPSRSLAQLLVLTGMRIGKLLELRWHNVDLKQNVIRVTQTVYEGHFDEPKSQRSRRSIPLGVKSIEILSKALWRTPRSWYSAPAGAHRLIDTIYSIGNSSPPAKNSVLRA